jgi:hypothetical protein
MTKIGDNLAFARLKATELTDTGIVLIDASGESRTIPLSEITAIALVGVKSASGFCGTMEWGMTNPTLILPVNLWNIIRNVVKRRQDVHHYKLTLAGGEEIIVICEGAIRREISRLQK